MFNLLLIVICIGLGGGGGCNSGRVRYCIGLMGFIVGLMGIMGLWKASGFLLWPPLLILIYPYISGYPEGVPRSGAVSRGDRPGWRAVPPGGAAHSRQPRADGGLAQAQGERLRQEQGGQTNGYKQRSHKIHFLRFRGMLNVFLFKMFSWAKCGGLLLDGAGKKSQLCPRLKSSRSMKPNFIKIVLPNCLPWEYY